ncbi:MAG: methyltransferase, partial [Gemmatimonadales bacterium]
LLGRFLEIVAHTGVLRQDGVDWVVVSVPADVSPDLQAAELLRRYPAFEAELTFAQRCGQGLGEALRGDCDALQLLFPGGDASTAEKLYRESPSAKVYNGVVQRVVEAALGQRQEGQPVRVLEIGGGTGSTSAYILPKLPPANTSYLFTDVSPLFTARAEARYRDYGFVTTQPLDIEKNPAVQGVTGQFDLVIAANVLHATRDLEETFRHVRQLLAPGGLLVILEVTAPQSWIDLSFGLTDGWWRFTDTALRSSYPLLSQPEWENFLTQQGFTDVALLPDATACSRTLGLNSVIVAQAPLSAASSTRRTDRGAWLILADKTGTGRRLADTLLRDGQEAIIALSGSSYAQHGPNEYSVNPASREDIERLLRDTLASATRPLRGVVHLWGSDIGPAAATTLRQLQQLELEICGSALHVAQSILTAKMPALPVLWVVTRGGVPLYSQPVSPLQAMLWGWARSLSLEHPELACRCVDLDPADASAGLDLLGRELLLSDGEDQVAYRQKGRYVARLQHSKLLPPRGTGLRVPEDGVFQLETAQRGALDQLLLRPCERRHPGPGEVEIQVRATGLNFRDVLNALNMYPGDPGPLGSECAGAVVAIGAGVDQLRVGDEVIAIAPGAFASHVLARTELVVRKPEKLTHQEAAAIPNAFLTAYWAFTHLGRMKRGERVLVHAAAGGVGLAAVQLAQQAGL